MISVCIATYNGEKYIKQQLLSILPQLGVHDEVIVSDDGSTDNTLNIIRNLNDNRIKIIDGPKTGAPIKNFENALKASKGDYIFLSDQDDVWHEHKVEACMTQLKQHACVVSDAFITDGELNITAPSFFQVNKTGKGKWYNLIIKNGYLGCCMALRREVLNRAIPFPANIPMHDIWIGNIAAFHFDIVFIPQQLIFFRRHSKNYSPTADQSIYTISEKFLFRWHIIRDLLQV